MVKKGVSISCHTTVVQALIVDIKGGSKGTRRGVYPFNRTLHATHIGLHRKKGEPIRKDMMVQLNKKPVKLIDICEDGKS